MNEATLSNLTTEEKEAFAAIEIAAIRRAHLETVAQAELEILFLSIDLSTAALNVLV